MLVKPTNGSEQPPIEASSWALQVQLTTTQNACYTATVLEWAFGTQLRGHAMQLSSKGLVWDACNMCAAVGCMQHVSPRMSARAAYVGTYAASKDACDMCALVGCMQNRPSISLYTLKWRF
eukprot:1158129-Pelagomonas_calceolata.AAC.12